MKELFKQYEEKKIDKEIVASIEKKKEHKLVGTQRKTNGHLLFKFNPSTLELNTDIKYKKNSVFISNFGTRAISNVNTSVEIEDGFIYIQALNKKNAIKKLNKLGYKL